MSILTIQLSEHAQKIYDLASPKGDKHRLAVACRGDKNDLEAAVKKMFIKLKASTKEQKDAIVDQIALTYQAQALYRRDQAKAGDRVPNPVGIAVWVNKGRYDTEIESHSELKEKTQAKICNKCSNEVIGPDFKLCHSCFANRRGVKEYPNVGFYHLYQELKKHIRFPGESHSEWINRLRETAINKGFKP